MTQYIILIIFILSIIFIIYSLLFPDFEYQIKNGNSFVYSLSWEDPDLDFKYLNVENDNVLMITTGGCNILNTLIKNPKKIVSVDISKNQNALLDLKLSAIKNLDYESFWLLFGKGKIRHFTYIYENILRKDLQLESSKQFWDSNKQIFKDGLYKSGGVGTVIYIMSCLNPNIDANIFTNFSDKSKQYEYYKKNIEPNIFNEWSKYFVKFPLFYSLTGVSYNQIKTICDGNDIDKLYNLLKKSYDHIIKKYSIKDDNYFMYGLLKGELRKENCPDYLKEENFNTLKLNVNKIKIVTSSISEYLEKTNLKFNKFILLDHLDWMKYEEINNEIKLIKSNNKKFEGIFRSGNKLPWYINIFKKNSINIKDISYESENDRLGTYPGFYKFALTE